MPAALCAQRIIRIYWEIQNCFGRNMHRSMQSDQLLRSHHSQEVLRSNHKERTPQWQQRYSTPSRSSSSTRRPRMHSNNPLQNMGAPPIMNLWTSTPQRSMKRHSVQGPPDSPACSTIMRGSSSSTDSSDNMCSISSSQANSSLLGLLPMTPRDRLMRDEDDDVFSSTSGFSSGRSSVSGASNIRLNLTNMLDDYEQANRHKFIRLHRKLIERDLAKLQVKVKEMQGKDIELRGRYNEVRGKRLLIDADIDLDTNAYSTTSPCPSTPKPSTPKPPIVSSTPTPSTPAPIPPPRRRRGKTPKRKGSFRMSPYLNTPVDRFTSKENCPGSPTLELERLQIEIQPRSPRSRFSTRAHQQGLRRNISVFGPNSTMTPLSNRLDSQSTKPEIDSTVVPDSSEDTGVLGGDVPFAFTMVGGAAKAEEPVNETPDARRSNGRSGLRKQRSSRKVYPLFFLENDNEQRQRYV